MTNLILTIIGIVLASLASILAIDYGGDYFVEGYNRAQATTIANVGDNVSAAFSVYSVQYRKTPDDIAQLTTTSAGRSLLKTVPEVNGLGTVRTSWVGLDRGSGIERAFAVEGISPALCQTLNERINNLAPDAVIPQSPAYRSGCMNYQGGGVNVYYSFLSPNLNGDLPTAYVPGVAPWQQTTGGGSSPVSSSGGTTPDPTPTATSTPDPTPTGSTINWQTCASEGQMCDIAGTTTVRYGADTRYVVQSQTDGFLCSVNRFGDPAPFVAKTCQFDPATAHLVQWVDCGSDPQTCTIPGKAEVRYGIPGQYLFGIVDHSAPCTTVTFGGDPAVQQQKSCQYRVDTLVSTPDPVNNPGTVVAGCSGGGEVDGGTITDSAGFSAHKTPDAMCAGDSLYSADRRFRLDFTSGGNFTLTYVPNGQVVWQAGTSDAVRFAMQPDGNAVLYNANNNASFSTRTDGYGGARMALREDGDLVVYNSSNNVIWETRSEICLPRSVSGGVIQGAYGRSGTVSPARICNNEYMDSPDGLFRLTMQPDGNLVLRKLSDGSSIWQSGTSNAYVAKSQSDGNEVLYSRDGNAPFSTNTGGYGGARFILQTDGDLVIRDAGNTRLLWETRSDICPPIEVDGGQLPGDYGVVGNSVNQRLCNHEYTTSPNGRFRLTMRADGNLVVGMGDGYANTIWQSGTSDAYALFVGTDGNMVERNRSGNSVWSTGTDGYGGANFVMQDDGNLVVRDSSNTRLLWETRSVYCLAAEKAAGTGTSNYGVIGSKVSARLCNNEYVTSPNGLFRLTMRADGNLVLGTGANYTNVIWQSGTSDGYLIYVQSDGNVTMKRRDGSQSFSTGTDGYGGAFMMVQDDGNLTVHSSDGSRLLWQTRSEICQAAEVGSGTKVGDYGVSGSVLPYKVCNNQYVTSPNGLFRLTMGSDGNVVLGTGTGFSNIIWQSGTSDAYAFFTQTNGNVQAIRRDGSTAFSTGTDGYGGAFMMVQDDGNLVVRDSGNTRVLWETRSEICQAAEKGAGPSQDGYGTAGVLVPLRLCNNEYVTSPNGRFRLTMSSSGDVALGMGDGYSTTIWHTGTSDAYAFFTQGNGNVVASRRDGSTAFSTGTDGYGGARMSLMNDGNLIVQSSDGTRLLWQSSSDHCLPASITAGTVTSPAGPSATMVPPKLCQNEYVTSPNGRFRFTLDPDGIVRLYDGVNHDIVLWTSGNAANADNYRLYVQGDGNVTLKRRDGSQQFSTGTDGYGGARLLVQDDGDVAVYDTNNNLRWHTNTGGKTGATPGSDDYKANQIRQAGANVYTAAGNTPYIPSTLADLGLPDQDYGGVGTFSSFYASAGRLMFEVKVSSASVCQKIADDVSGNISDTSQETTTPEGCASFSSGYYYWRRMDDAQASPQADFARAFGARVYSASAAATAPPTSLTDIGLQDADRSNFMPRTGFEAAGENRHFYSVISSAAACRAIDARINGTRTIDANTGFSYSLAEGCGGEGGSYYYFINVNGAYDPALVTNVRAAGGRATSAVVANGGEAVQAARDAASAVLTSYANGNGFVTKTGIYQETSDYFAEIRIASAAACRLIDQASGNGDRGANLVFDPTDLAEGCGQYTDGNYWYWKRLISTGHRYWRVLAHRTNGDSPYLATSEIELRATPGGPNLIDGTSGGTAIASATYASGYEPYHAFDLSPSSGPWASPASDISDINQWIGYDFGNSRLVDVQEVVWHSRTDCCTDQSIGSGELQWSDDGSAWTTSFGFVASPITSAGQTSTFTQPAAPAADAHRYWRVKGYQINDSYMRASEIEFAETVGGVNVARYGVPFASSSYDGNNIVEFAFNGTTSGNNWANTGGLGYAGVDMLVPRSINELRYAAVNGKAPTDFGIEWSDDKQNWTEAWHATYSAWNGYQLTSFPRVSATPTPTPSPTATGPVSGIMASSVVIMGGINSSCMQIAELEAYPGGVNVALASNGGVASSSAPYSDAANAQNTNDGVKPAGYPQIFHSSCSNGDFLRIDFASPVPISKLSLYGRQDCCSNRDLYSYQLFNGTTVVSSGRIDATSGEGDVDTDPADNPS